MTWQDPELPGPRTARLQPPGPRSRPQTLAPQIQDPRTHVPNPTLSFVSLTGWVCYVGLGWWVCPCMDIELAPWFQRGGEWRGLTVSRSSDVEMWLLFTGWYLKIKISDKIWNNHPLFCLSKKPSPSPLMMNGSISTVKTNHRSEARCGRGWLHWLHCTGLIFLPLQCTGSVERHSAVHIVVHNCTS